MDCSPGERIIILAAGDGTFLPAKGLRRQGEKEPRLGGGAQGRS